MLTARLELRVYEIKISVLVNVLKLASDMPRVINRENARGGAYLRYLSNWRKDNAHLKFVSIAKRNRRYTSNFYGIDNKI
ncbi:MAG: hypothetical protein GPOALKHO_000911 [Sodalis sp.]|nr:MAG: hypothetical protein GPOALKHO_000911 [Sodalis sp.]